MFLGVFSIGHAPQPLASLWLSHKVKEIDLSQISSYGILNCTLMPVWPVTVGGKTYSWKAVHVTAR